MLIYPLHPHTRTPGQQQPRTHLRETSSISPSCRLWLFSNGRDIAGIVREGHPRAGLHDSSPRYEKWSTTVIGIAFLVQSLQQRKKESPLSESSTGEKDFVCPIVKHILYNSMSLALRKSPQVSWYYSRPCSVVTVPASISTPNNSNNPPSKLQRSPA